MIALKDAINRLHSITLGIDMDEIQDDAGWWSNSSGANFGAQKLAELEGLITEAYEK